MAAGDLAPCALKWEAGEVVLVKKSVQEVEKELLKLVRNKVDGWWNQKYDMEGKVKEKLAQKWIKKDKEESETMSVVEETDGGVKLQNMLLSDSDHGATILSTNELHSESEKELTARRNSEECFWRKNEQFEEDAAVLYLSSKDI